MHITLLKKRGVSPIISALLLVVIVISGFSILYSATNNWIRAQRRTDFLYMQERFIIEDVWFRTSGGTRSLVTLFIRNIGDVDVTITQCKIDDTEYTIEPPELELIPGIAGRLHVTFSWSPEITYKIVVITDRGSVIATDETA